MGRERRDQTLLTLVIFSGVVLIAIEMLSAQGGKAPELVSDVCLFAAGLISGAVILVRSRRPGAWQGMPGFGLAMLVMALAKGVESIGDLNGDASLPDNIDLLF